MTKETHHPPSEAMLGIKSHHHHRASERALVAGRSAETYKHYDKAQECSRREQALVELSPTYDSNNQPDVPNPVMAFLEEGNVGMERELV